MSNIIDLKSARNNHLNKTKEAKLESLKSSFKASREEATSKSKSTNNLKKLFVSKKSSKKKTPIK